jgi:energy-coupling factor transporter transmembrane protein EcfT|tara:strand:+ start:2303 stop:2986 length:684 start_codon:yes stop_codon:yes gene_type:complete
MAFSVSVLLSMEIGILTLHILIAISLLIFERDQWSEWKNRTRPFWKYFPLTGLIFFVISFLVSDRSISTIIMDVTLATLRLIVMVSVMTIYTLKSSSQDVITAFRSIWFKMNLNYRWVEDLLLFFDMTVRFFPTFKEEWRQLERSQKALSISISESYLKKVIQVAQFVPDFIILNLNKSESITRVMKMRGYGESIPRSVFPFIKFTFFDLTLVLLIPIILIGVHSIG